jgi:hypothetical protein
MRRTFAIAALVFCALAATAEARITRIEIASTAPAFSGRSFGGAGSFELLTGRAFGEVDPKSPANARIQDIGLAQTNAAGRVEYSTDIAILRPADPAKSNGVLLFNILNRGNKGALGLFNADVAGGPAEINRVADAGDGWLQRQGYTLIWFGWQADVLPGDARMTLSVPVARNPDNSPNRHRAQRVADARACHDAQPLDRLLHGADARLLSHGQHGQPHPLTG